MTVITSWILTLSVFMLYSAGFVLGTSLSDDTLYVQSRYKHLFNTLNDLNFTTYNLVKLLSENKNSSLFSLRDSRDQECWDGLNAYFDGLLEAKLWAIKMLDASSKIPPGILLGGLTDLGSYEECLSITYTDGSPQFSGQHCMINLLVDLNLTTFEAEVSKTKGITMSLCLPSTCSVQFLSRQFHALGRDINYLLKSFHHNETVSVWMDETSCHFQQISYWTPGQVVGMVVTTFLISKVLGVNFLVFLIKKSFPQGVPKKLKGYTKAFSITSNWKTLTSTESTDDTIQVLYGFKFLSILWVCLAHHIKLSVQSPIMGLSLLKVAQYLKEEQSILILNATLGVEVFFLISGILNTYTYFDTRRMKNKRFLSHVKRFAKRYMRLTPAYATVVMGTSTWLYFVGDGPLWDQTIKHERDNCVNYWWANLLYFNNYYDPVKCCMTQSWYIAAEMQLFLASTIILYPLWRWPRAGLVQIAFFITLSLAVQFGVVFIYRIKTPIPFSMDKEKMDLQTTVFFAPTHTRTTSYILGILCGYGLHLVKRKGVFLKIKPYQNVILWLVAFTCTTSAVLSGHHLFELHSRYDQLESSTYISFFRFFWSIGISWMILACTTNRGGVINSILSWKIWMPLGRLSYGIYLTHVTVVLYTLGTLREPEYFNTFNLITGFGGEFLITIMFAVILALFVELPMCALVSLMTRPTQDVSDDTDSIRSEDSQPQDCDVQEPLFPRLALLY